jgi:hypothetical protein
MIQVPEEVVIVLDRDLDDHVQKARENFTQKDLSAAAADLRRVAALLKLEAGERPALHPRPWMAGNEAEKTRMRAFIDRQLDLPRLGLPIVHVAVDLLHGGDGREH